MRFARLIPMSAVPLLTLSLCSIPGAAGQIATQHYQVTKLTANLSGGAPVTDPNLVNPWGLSRSSAGPWWVSDNGTGLSTLYSGSGSTIPLVVKIPPADPAKTPTGSPTGTIFNGGTSFQLTPGNPAAFLFVTEDGTISGWSPKVNPGSAVIVVNTKGKSSFKGATIANVSGQEQNHEQHQEPDQEQTSYLYAADFLKGRIQVYDSNFNHVTHMEESFEDDDLPYGFAPFNIQNIGGNLYVTYALQDGTKLNEVDGPGLGYVNVFSPNGRLLHHLAHGSYFNAPWGLAQASSDFGKFSHDILVGQFGSGEILAFNSLTGAFDGTLNDQTNAPLKIDGLWALVFGNNGNSGPATSLYFAAGTNHEQGGTLGAIVAVENVQGNDR